jgi:hypothetical protein
VQLRRLAMLRLSVKSRRRRRRQMVIRVTVVQNVAMARLLSVVTRELPRVIEVRSLQDQAQSNDLSMGHLHALWARLHSLL